MHFPVNERPDFEQFMLMLSRFAAYEFHDDAARYVMEHAGEIYERRDVVTVLSAWHKAYEFATDGRESYLYELGMYKHGKGYYEPYDDSPIYKSEATAIAQMVHTLIGPEWDEGE